jgi:hypothetical protein
MSTEDVYGRRGVTAMKEGERRGPIWWANSPRHGGKREEERDIQF